jgi:hypothetical protein
MTRTSTAVRGSVIAIVIGALLAPVIASPAAGADDDVIIIPSTIPLITQSSDSSFITVEGTGAIDITVPTGETIQPQCVPIAGGIVTCIGAPSERDPLEDTGVGGLSDFLASDSGDHVGALGWIIREAIDALAVLYDVPNDGRIERYAGDEIRGYVLSRVIDIFDRSLYGVALTPDEQKTYDYFTEIFLESDRAVAEYAQEEYTRFMTNECGYRPPAAPAFVTDPVLLPEAVANWCSRPRTSLENQFVFAPPIPSAAEFQAWGVYRNADALGLNSLTNGTVQQNLVDAQNAAYQIGAVGAVAGAAIAGGAASAFVAGSASGLAGAIAGAVFPYAGSTFFVASGVTGTAGTTVVTGSVVGSAAFAAATVVAVVVLAIVVTAVAVVQLVAYEEVGRTVSANLANALASRDPFGLDARRAEFAGLDLRENLSLDNLPAYRSSNAMARILATVVDVTSARYGGVYVADASGVWTDNATTASDFSFMVTDSEGTRAASSIVIPVAGVSTTVRFSDGWIITDGGSGERATFSFPFITPDGKAALASRTALSEGGFTVSVLQPDNTLLQENVDTIEFLDENDDVVSVSLVSDSTSGLAGPTPSAVGPLTPGRTVILRPNPVDINGTFDLDRFVDGYDYSWTIVRHEPSSNSWVEVAQADGYDTRFVPQAIGAYRASVLMRDTDPSDGTDDDVWGAVNFTVSAPTPQVTSMVLDDDGIDTLALSLQLASDVPSNEYTVAVTWPGSVDGDAPTTTALTLPCIQVDALSCSTVNTALFSEFDDELSYTLPHDAALAQGVTVSITDRFGGGTTQRFAIDDAARPTVIAPETSPSPVQPGIVTFAPEMTTLQVPVGYGVDPNYEIARLEPGTGGTPTNFGLVDPSTDLPVSSLELPGGGARASIVYDADLDQWVVSIRVTATAAEVGRQVVPLVVQQVTGARTVLPLTLDLVPASGDRFRGAVASSVDPANFAVEALPTLVPYVMGGKAEWGEYTSDVCVSLEYTEFPSTPIESCGPVADLLDADGAFEPIAFRDFAPNGLRAGRYEVAVSVPGTERADATPIVSSFRLLVGPPTVGAITWNATTGAVAFTIDPANPETPIETVECRLDDVIVDCGDATRGVWPGGSLALGERTFTVDVTAEGGNYAQRSLTFTVTETVDPEPTPSPAITLSTRSVAAGDTLTVSGEGFSPDETVQIELQSDPVVLATIDADESGTFQTSVTVPRDTSPGPHDIVATGAISDEEVRVRITVLPAGDIASTGAAPLNGLLAFVVLAIMLGLGIVLIRRRMLMSQKPETSPRA